MKAPQQTIIVVLGILAFLISSTAQAETIRLKSGEVIEGTIVERRADAIKVDTGIGIAVTYYLDEIEETPLVTTAAQPQINEVVPNPPAIVIPTPVPLTPVKTPNPPPEKPASISTSQLHSRQIEMGLYSGATDASYIPPEPLPKDEYLKTQFARANAVQKERLLQAVSLFKEQTRNIWQKIKNDHPFIKDLAQGPAGIPLGVGLALSLYILFFFPLMKIAHKLDEPAWMAWVPVLQIFLMIRIAEKSLLWILFLPVPLANILAFLFIWMSIARRLEQPHWMGYLMIVPGINFLVAWYLALFSLRTIPAIPSAPNSKINYQ